MLLNQRQSQGWSSSHDGVGQVPLSDRFREGRRGRTWSHSALLQQSSADSCCGKCLTFYWCMMHFSAIMQETWCFEWWIDLCVRYSGERAGSQSLLKNTEFHCLHSQWHVLLFQWYYMALLGTVCPSKADDFCHKNSVNSLNPHLRLCQGWSRKLFQVENTM